MAIVYLALGSNVGDSKKNISSAIGLLEKSITSIKKAPLYTSHAVGYTDQADFVNTVVMGDTKLSPKELLVFVKGIEEQIGRIKRFRWGPREIDIDIIFYDNKIINEDNLTIPHSRLAERDFVLRPLCDIDPGLIDPVSKRNVKKLLDDIAIVDRSIISQE